MNTEIEKMKQEKERNERKLAQCRHQEQRLKNLISYYEQGERRKRAHRLITRGAAVEILVPAIKEMGEVEFYALAEKVFSLPEVRRLLSENRGDSV